MTKNTLSDLNNHLFEQLERLNDDELNQEELEKEIKRSTAMTNVAKNIIDNAQLILKAEEFRTEYGGKVKTPKLLE
ncbi:MAG TPA: hypothetical protein H9948_11115 [Candidatus Jeotgalibaca merdavium]|uniref:Phage protein n=1 Tax=Candidatus Jeotgalibaca merdavium TaxID=2838627 RepID=A0A9D2I151_9LACT|nr:hypothetical protein [Candidatus Jeotgalibaca merdavium]